MVDFLPHRNRRFMKILCGTSYIEEDEDCFELYEQDVQPPDNSGFHRFRVYRVLRDGRITEYREDLGVSSNFKGIEPVVILGGVVEGGGMEIFETVGSMRQMVDQYRNHVHFDKFELAGVDKIRL